MADQDPDREPSERDDHDRAQPQEPGKDGDGAKADGAKGDGDKGDRKDEKPKKPNPLKNPLVIVGIVAVVVVIAVVALIWWLHARQYESTDDAFVDTHIIRLAPQVAGQVSTVRVDDNVLVQPGQVLVEIDSATARANLEQALGQRGEAVAKLAQAQAQVGVSQAQWSQSRQQEAGLAATADVAARDAARYRTLQANAPRAVAGTQVDQAAGQARNTAAQRDAAAAQARGALAQLQAARTGIAGAKATLQSAEATIAENRITLGHNTVVAPVEGYVTQKNVAPGAYVQPGQQILAIVPRQMWVTANFKETQLKLMRVGQPVTMSIDACPTTLHGHVLSIQRGAGQAFALLPSENASGNYVKVVQRVPVKIGFDDVPRDCPLGPGLSVTPKVKVR